MVDPFCWQDYQLNNDFKAAAYVPPTVCKKVNHPFKDSYPLFPHVALERNQLLGELAMPSLIVTPGRFNDNLDQGNLFQVNDNSQLVPIAQASCSNQNVFGFTTSLLDLSKSPSYSHPPSPIPGVSNRVRASGPIIPHKKIGDSCEPPAKKSHTSSAEFDSPAKGAESSKSNSDEEDPPILHIS
jgi:hypothetical protein